MSAQHTPGWRGPWEIRTLVCDDAKRRSFVRRSTSIPGVSEWLHGEHGKVARFDSPRAARAAIAAIAATGSAA
ncbi:MAG TPA: hypothetical protein VNU71_13330 [Burkholderiaceae bacterium]|nr:hypothetical protein [Burkholderiaceae bacterium]